MSKGSSRAARRRAVVVAMVGLVVYSVIVAG
jgi:hypothetical protein